MHGYSPIYISLNRRARKNVKLKILHLMGGKAQFPRANGAQGQVKLFDLHFSHGDPREILVELFFLITDRKIYENKFLRALRLWQGGKKVKKKIGRSLPLLKGGDKR